MYYRPYLKNKEERMAEIHIYLQQQSVQIEQI
jgi:hypothetical protein